MATKKLAVATTTKTRTFKGTTRPAKKTVAKKSFFSYFNFSESYTSLILGMVLVVIASIFVLSLLKNSGLHFRSSIQDTSSTSTQNTTSNTTMSQATPKTYTVAAGDDLWKIAEKVYKNGYNWVDIAKANNLTNPNVLYVGTKLTLPSVTPAPTQTIAQAQPTQTTVNQTQSAGTNTISGSTYTVVHGDDLWHIALKKYNNGYKWVDIARANGLVHPSQIHAGNVLKLP